MPTSAPNANINVGKLKAAWDWENFARPEQLEPEGDWRVWLIETGRGWGKTRTGAETVVKRVRDGKSRSIALVAPTAADARDVMVDELEQQAGILTVSPPWFRPKYESSKRRLVWPNGAVATVFSAEDPDQLRGPQHDFAWCDELAAWPKNTMERVWSNLMFGLRLGRSQCMVTTTPRPIPLLRELMKRPTTHLTTGTTYDNMANLSKEFFDEIITPYEGTRLGRQELLGQLLDDNPDALWTYENFDLNRYTKDTVPQLKRVVVAVDPAGSSEGHEIGIVVGGVAPILNKAKERVEEHGFVLGDYSMSGMPDDWARAVIKAYDEHKANYVVVERNYGGDMVSNTIRLQCQILGHAPIPVREVQATRGKLVRAEPISGLAMTNRIHHVGTFGGLEDQLVMFVTGEANDRVDAYVWLFTDLMATKGGRVFTW